MVLVLASAVFVARSLDAGRMTDAVLAASSSAPLL